MSFKTRSSIALFVNRCREEFLSNRLLVGRLLRGHFTSFLSTVGVVVGVARN